jgi:hypothetical protein
MEKFKNTTDAFCYYLEYCAELLGDRGCNDCFLENSLENRNFICDYNKWNNKDRIEGEDLSPLPDNRGLLFIPDFALFDFMVYKLKNNK